MTINHGLQDKQLNIIKEILKNFASSIDKVCLFGSRATGSYKNYSDIDLVIYGDISDKNIDRLRTIFFESGLPYKVDINAYHLINYPPFKNHIDSYGKILFSKNQLINH